MKRCAWLIPVRQLPVSKKRSTTVTHIQEKRSKGAALEREGYGIYLKLFETEEKE